MSEAVAGRGRIESGGNFVEFPPFSFMKGDYDETTCTNKDRSETADSRGY
jgi:hypothetical protein